MKGVQAGSKEPRRIRPTFPESWHVPNEPKKWITWNRANEKLAQERVYWVSTTRADGRPHAAPVWGIWKDNRLFFETDPGSVKGKNLKRNGAIVVHIQDGSDTVIVEGKATREAAKGVLDALVNDYAGKYDYRPDWSDPTSQIVFRVVPKTVHAWKAPHMHHSLVRFEF